MIPRFQKLTFSRSAFTILEVLVSTAILAMLVTLLFSMMGAFNDIYSSGKQSSKTQAAARTALAVATRDLEQAILRGDLPANGFGLNAANQPEDRNACFFLTQRESLRDASASTNANNPARAISRVCYHVINGVLTRSSTGLAFNNSIFSTTALGVLAPTDFALIEGVVDFRIQFVDPSGSLGPTFVPATATAPGSCAATISLALMDEKTLAIKKDSLTGFVSTLRGKLNASPPAADASYADTWRQQIDTSGFFDGQPGSLRKGLQVFSVRVPIPTSQ
jgi:type II secretory pathway component PulJ